VLASSAMVLISAGLLAVPTTVSAQTPTWSIANTPNDGTPDGMLYGVACPGTSTCFGVGYWTRGTGLSAQIVMLAEARHGTNWATQKLGGTDGELYAVSCTSVSACTAVGGNFDNETILAETRTGNQWKSSSLPNPTGSYAGELDSVSCTKTPTAACTAVGSYDDGGTAQIPFAESEKSGTDGGAWTVSYPPPAPAGASETELTGVSCTSADHCVAVGWYYDSTVGYGFTLAEIWDGSNWTIQTTPNPSNATSGSELESVSCTAADACTAVGEYDPTSGIYQSLAETWNGTAWSITPTPNPTGSFATQFSGVSCTWTDACTAVGYWENGAGQPNEFTLAEDWNGGSWSLETTPNETGDPASELSGAVACTAATACTAVGTNYTPKNKSSVLAEVESP
jgi:hypothetical protein